MCLLVDTGADSSLIKKSSLREDVILETSNVKELRGAFGGFSKTEGMVELRDSERGKIAFKMHCISNENCLPSDGIIGRDNLWGRSMIDSRKNTLTIYTELGDHVMKLVSSEATNDMSQTGATENLTVIEPPERIIAEARAVTIVALNIRAKSSEIVVDKQELAPGIYLGGAATRVIKGRAFAPILNATDRAFVLDNGFVPKFTTMGKYKNPINGLVARLQEVDVRDRVDKILKTVRTDENLNAEERASFEGICAAYHDVFHLDGDKLSCTSLVKHRIPIMDGQQPINQRQYRLPQAHKSLIHKHVEELEKDGKVRKSLSPWNSPLLLVPKKSSEEGRMVVDFRRLNEVTVKQVFPIPRMDEILDQLGRSRYFSTLDLASGYHQVEVDERDREKTAFSTAFGHYEFTRMPFGLTGAPATFQRLMNHVLTGLECFVYLDDIVVYGGNLSEHEARLCRVLQRLRESNLKVKTEKCNFLRREIIYLGHKCSEQGALPDEEKVRCVKDFPVPRNRKQVQSFLGLVNYNRKFIPGTAAIALPINKLIRKETKFVWSEECQQAFDRLKSAIASPPVLAYPDFEKDFVLTTDASNGALGAVLSQMVDDILRQ